MNEANAMEWLDAIRKRGSIPGLESIRELLGRIGNPQKDLKVIHIAGTNGKGSISAYLATILAAQGYRVGRYNSPTLLTYWERIRVNQANISKRAMAEGLTLIREKSEEMEEDGFRPITIFEAETALALWYFKQKKCDPVILEVGMGGIQDATNVADNVMVSVFASISMDHMQFLGDTLAQIARQKAGIIRENTAVVSIKQQEEAMQVLNEEAKRNHTEVTIACPSQIYGRKASLQKQSFSYSTYHNMEISLLGEYQPENAIVAIEVIEKLQKAGYRISERNLRLGLKETEWFGRFTVLKRNPCFIVDGAHNEDAAKKLAQTLRFYFTNREIVFIMGILKDKESDKIIRETVELASSIITVTPPIRERAMSAMDLAKEIRNYHTSVTAADSVSEAVELASLLAGEKGIVVAFGSLSYLGEVAEALQKNPKKRTEK